MTQAEHLANWNLGRCFGAFLLLSGIADDAEWPADSWDAVESECLKLRRAVSHIARIIRPAAFADKRRKLWNDRKLPDGREWRWIAVALLSFVGRCRNRMESVRIKLDVSCFATSRAGVLG